MSISERVARIRAEIHEMVEAETAPLREDLMGEKMEQRLLMAGIMPREREFSHLPGSKETVITFAETVSQGRIDNFIKSLTSNLYDVLGQGLKYTITFRL